MALSKGSKNLYKLIEEHARVIKDDSFKIFNDWIPSLI